MGTPIFDSNYVFHLVMLPLGRFIFYFFEIWLFGDFSLVEHVSGFSNFELGHRSLTRIMYFTSACYPLEGFFFFFQNLAFWRFFIGGACIWFFKFRARTPFFDSNYIFHLGKLPLGSFFFFFRNLAFWRLFIGGACIWFFKFRARTPIFDSNYVFHLGMLPLGRFFFLFSPM